MIFISPLDLGPSDLSFGVGFIHHDLTHSRLRSPNIDESATSLAPRAHEALSIASEGFIPPVCRIDCLTPGEGLEKPRHHLGVEGTPRRECRTRFPVPREGLKTPPLLLHRLRGILVRVRVLGFLY